MTTEALYMSNVALQQRVRDLETHIARLEAEHTRGSVSALTMLQHNNLLEQVPAAICILQGPDLVFTFANGPYWDIVGPRKLIGLPLREALPELEGQGFFELLEGVYATGEACAGNEQLAYLHTDDSGTTQEGWYNFLYQPVYGANRQIDGVFVHAVNVTEQVRARRELEDRARSIEQLNTALHQQHLLLEGLLSHSPAAVFIKDLAGRFLHVNGVFANLFGYQLDQVIGNYQSDLFPADVVATWQEEDQMIVETGEPLKLERTYMHEGRLCTFLTTKFPIYNTAGQVYALGGIVLDITAQQQTQQELAELNRALRESQTLLNQMLAYSPNPTFVADLQGRYLHVNQAFAALHNRSVEAMTGITREDFVPPELVQLWQQEDRMILESGRPLIIENRVPPPDGPTIYILTKFPIYDEHGNIAAFGGISTDITTRKHAAEALRQQNSYLEALNRAYPVAIVQLDMDDVVETWNQAAETLFGYSAAEAIGQHVATLIANTAPMRREAHGLLGMMAHGRTIRAQTRRHRKDGSMVDVQLVGVPLRVDNQVTSYVVVYHDISELVEARREAEAANQAKTVFLASVSHELRTPMNAVLGMTSLLLSTPLSPEQRDYIETIRLSGNALLALMNDILDFSKIEAGKLDLEYYPFSLHTCIEEALDLVAGSAAAKRLYLAADIALDVPDQLVGDSARLRQVLVNLLSNAIKFTEQGEVVIHASAQPVQVAGTSAHNGNAPEPPTRYYTLFLEVRDTGIGIPQQHLNRIFEAFVQADTSIARTHGGTGLGLAISSRLTELMGGSIHATSRPGQGSIFALELPMETADPTPDEQSAFLQPCPPALAGKRALLVAANPTGQAIITRYATHWGMHVDVVASEEEAELVAAGHPAIDMILLDTMELATDIVVLAHSLRRLLGAPDNEQTVPLVVWAPLDQRPLLMHNTSLPRTVWLAHPVRPAVLHAILLQLTDPSPTLHRPGPEPDLRQNMAARHPLHLLLAEDNATNQRVALRLLEQLGYRADVVSNGLEVLDALKRQWYDVLLMDVQMPEMNGTEAAQYIRSFWPANQQPAIVAVTAYALDESQQWLLRMGMDDYVKKPLQLGEIAAVLERIPARSRPPTSTAGQPEPGEHDEQGTSSVASAATRKTGQAAALPADEAPVNMGMVDELLAVLGSDAAFQSETFLLLYLEDIAEVLEHLREALEASDAPRFQRLSHTLKSMSAQIGALRLSLLAQRMETSGLDTSSADTVLLVSQTESEYQRVRAAILARYRIDVDTSANPGR